jgi:hypothetical protein
MLKGIILESYPVEPDSRPHQRLVSGCLIQPEPRSKNVAFFSHRSEILFISQVSLASTDICNFSDRLVPRFYSRVSSSVGSSTWHLQDEG